MWATVNVPQPNVFNMWGNMLNVLNMWGMAVALPYNSALHFVCYVCNACWVTGQGNSLKDLGHVLLTSSVTMMGPKGGPDDHVLFEDDIIGSLFYNRGGWYQICFPGDFCG